MTAPWNKGRKLSEAHRKKLSMALSGRRLSDEHRRKMFIMMKGNKYALGYRHTEETKEKISISHKGHTPWNRGIKAWNNGKQWPAEVKENISKGMIAYWIDRKLQTERKIKIS